MALTRNEVRTEFTSDASDLEEGSRRGQSAFGSLGGAITRVGALLSALATGAFAIFLAKATQAASTAQETQNLFDVSFAEMAGAAEEWAKRTQAAVGVNDTTLKSFSGTLFNMVTSMGIARDEAFKLATGFTELALDASSFFNISFDQAFNKIRAGLAGESEPLKQLGILVTENTIKQTEFAQAILATGRQLTETEKVQARAIVIQEGLSNASGDLIRTQDSWANQTRLVGEAWTDLLEVVGSFITESTAVGGAVSSITDRIRDLTKSIEENRDTWSKVVTFIVSFFIAAIEQTIKVIAFLLDHIGRLSITLGLFAQTLGTLPGVNDDFGRSLRDAGQFMKDLSAQAPKLTADLANFRDEIANSAPGVKSAAAETAAFTEEQRAAAPAVAATAAEIKKQKDAYLEFIVTQQRSREEMIAFRAELALHAKEWDAATDAIFAGNEAQQEAKLAAFQAANAHEVATTKITKLYLEEQKSVDITRTLADVLSETRGLMTLFGVAAESTAGKIINAFSKVFDVFNSVLGIVGKLSGAFGGGGFSLGNLLGIGGGAAGAAASAGGVGAGAAAGAGAGGGGFGALAGLLTNPLTGILAGGALAGFFGVKALTRKGSAETTAEFLGLDFDALSKSLQDSLQDMGKQIGDFATSIQLNLGQVFSEGGLGQNFDLLAEKAADTFSFLDRKQIDATQAQQVLNDTAGQMIQIVDQMGAMGVKELERLLSAAQRTGVGFDGMSELAIAYVKRADELGIAVNNVVLEALGLEGALALLSQSGTANLDSLKASADDVARALDRAERAGGGVNPGGAIPMQHGGFGETTRPTLFRTSERGQREGFAFFPGGLPVRTGATDESMKIIISVDARGAIGLSERALGEVVVRAVDQNLSEIRSKLKRRLS